MILYQMAGYLANIESKMSQFVEYASEIYQNLRAKMITIYHVL